MKKSVDQPRAVPAIIWNKKIKNKYSTVCMSICHFSTSTCALACLIAFFQARTSLYIVQTRKLKGPAFPAQRICLSSTRINTGCALPVNPADRWVMSMETCVCDPVLPAEGSLVSDSPLRMRAACKMMGLKPQFGQLLQTCTHDLAKACSGVCKVYSSLGRVSLALNKKIPKKTVFCLCRALQKTLLGVKSLSTALKTCTRQHSACQGFGGGPSSV